MRPVPKLTYEEFRDQVPAAFRVTRGEHKGSRVREFRELVGRIIRDYRTKVMPSTNSEKNRHKRWRNWFDLIDFGDEARSKIANIDDDRVSGLLDGQFDIENYILIYCRLHADFDHPEYADEIDMVVFEELLRDSPSPVFLQRPKLRRVKGTTYNTDEIIVLEYGPRISVDHLSLRTSGEQFFMPFWEGVAEKLVDRGLGYSVRNTTREAYFTFSDIDELAEVMGIPFLSKLAPEVRHRVSQWFLNDADGIRFNGGLFGLRSIRLNTRDPDAAEEAYFSGTVFETDYFTFRVMNELHRELLLRQREHTLHSYTDQSSINKRLYPFLCSIGLNVYVTTDHGTRLVLVRRGRNAATFGKPPLIYPSANEALSWTDVVSTVEHGNLPSVKMCLERGLNEELGVSPDLISDVQYTHIAMGTVGIAAGVHAIVDLDWVIPPFLEGRFSRI